MFDTVVVGYDGSPQSARAADWAATEALARQAILRIVTCAEIPLLGRTSGMTLEQIDAIEDRAADALVVVAARLGDRHPELKIDTDLLPERSRSAMVDEADRADVVVLGAGCRSGHGRGIRSTTARALVGRSATPLVIVPQVHSATAPRRVVVGVDGTDVSIDATEWAADEAAARDAELLLVHCRPGRSAQDDDLAAIILDDALRISCSRTPGKVAARLLHREPTEALLDVARPDDLVVIGRSAPHALSDLAFGSTTAALLDHAHVPVAIAGQLR